MKEPVPCQENCFFMVRLQRIEEKTFNIKDQILRTGPPKDVNSYDIIYFYYSIHSSANNFKI
jgi:hypothetical protein